LEVLLFGCGESGDQAGGGGEEGRGCGSEMHGRSVGGWVGWWGRKKKKKKEGRNE
jgi:hypothetical protein